MGWKKPYQFYYLQHIMLTCLFCFALDIVTHVRWRLFNNFREGERRKPQQDILKEVEPALKRLWETPPTAQPAGSENGNHNAVTNTLPSDQPGGDSLLQSLFSNFSDFHNNNIQISINYCENPKKIKFCCFLFYFDIKLALRSGW